MAKTKKKTKQNPSVRNLRSVNIVLDISEPSRLQGYIPTAKSIELTKKVMSGLYNKSTERAFAAAAPYGSGKSSAALVWCALAEGSLKSAAPALYAEVTKELKKNGLDLSTSKKAILSVPLQGFEESVSKQVLDGLVTALKRRNLKSIVTKLKGLPRDIDGVIKAIETIQTFGGAKAKGILIVWDEFGKLLEHGAAKGESKALFEIQTLAEYVQRSTSDFPVQLCLLLHQSFSQYATNLPSYVKSEWSKIEGRFNRIDYIEDSKEIYNLISEVASRPTSISPKVATELAKKCHSLKVFKEFSQKALVEIIRKSAQLNPLSLYILPHLSARVGQNERTLFTFLCSDDRNGYLSYGGKETVTPDKVFDYFSDLMRTDTGVGGTHKLWAQLQNALEKAEAVEEERLIKTIGCLSLAKGQTALHTTPDVLALAFGGVDAEAKKQISARLNALLKKKVVFFHRLHNEFTVWQATDTDLRSAVLDRKNRYEQSVDVRTFLAEEYPTPARYPQRHNDQRAIRRYFDGALIHASEVDSLSKISDDDIRDGRIYYVIAESNSDIKAARKAAADIKSSKKVIAIPKKPLGIRSSVAELRAYHELQGDPEFAGQGSGVVKELNQLADESEQYLRHNLRGLFDPGAEGPTYYYCGKAGSGISNLGDLKRFLSEICDKLYPKTPYLNNEMINKAEPSPSIVNGRKKIMRAILDSYGSENLSLDGYGPDVSIFRAIFITTGLYRKSKSRYRFAKPSEIEDKHLGEIWGKFIDFWSKPSTEPKSLALLLKELNSPPYGVRDGVIPPLLCASFRIANNVINVLEEGTYRSEVTAENFERMLRNPDAFTIEVPVLDKKITAYLNSLAKMFGGAQQEGSEDPIRLSISSIMAWAGGLPQCARNQRMVSAETDKFVQVLTSAKNPSEFLLKDLPEAANADFEETLKWLKKRKHEMEKLESKLIQTCRKSIFKSIGALNTGELQEVLTQWKAALPGETDQYGGDPIMSGFLTRASHSYESDDQFTRSMAELFSSKPLRFWESSHLSKFELNLARTVKNIEAIAETIDLESINPSTKGAVKAPWTERKIKRELTAIQKKLGADRTKKFLHKILSEIDKEDLDAK